MKAFKETTNSSYYFSSCDICDAKCCKGFYNTVCSQIILEDFEKVYENFPIVFMLGELNYLKPVILLTNGIDDCKYLENNKCNIYEKRPQVCRTYPLSPHLTNIPYIDINCPAVGEDGKLIVQNTVVGNEFNHEVFDNYQDKYIKMHFHFDKFNDKENIKFLIKIRNENFYIFKEDFSDEFLKMHLSSLKNFDNYFKI